MNKLRSHEIVRARLVETRKFIAGNGLWTTVFAIAVIGCNIDFILVSRIIAIGVVISIMVDMTKLGSHGMFTRKYKDQRLIRNMAAKMLFCLITAACLDNMTWGLAIVSTILYICMGIAVIQMIIGITCARNIVKDLICD